MVEATYFRKVRTALIYRCAERDLSVAEVLRVAHLQSSGFSPIAAANVLIATRSIGRLA